MACCRSSATIRACGSDAIRPTLPGSRRSRSRPRWSRGFRSPERGAIRGGAVDDLAQQLDQAVAPALADTGDHAALMRLQHGFELAHQRDAVAGQVERIGALVARGLAPLGERAPLELVEQADEI